MENVLRARLSADLNLPQSLGGGMALDQSQALDRARALALDRALDRALALALDRARGRARALDRIRALDRLSDVFDSWSNFPGDPGAHGPMLDVICELLDLGPTPHWREMHRLRLLPQIPSRITIADPELWHSVELAFQSGSATEADVHHAATFLLLDIWLWVTKCYQTPPASRFYHLAELTRTSTAPELRIAHCLRDIAHGIESREADLRVMVESRDPATHRMFIDSFWIDDDDSPKRTKRQ